MKKRFTEKQIAYVLKCNETGTKVVDICREMGVSEAPFYRWKTKYAGLDARDLRKLKALEEENRQLKKLVADLSLDKQILQDVLKKSSKARPKAGHSHGRMCSLSYRPETSLPGSSNVPFDLLLQATRPGCHGSGDAIGRFSAYQRTVRVSQVT